MKNLRRLGVIVLLSLGLLMGGASVAGAQVATPAASPVVTTTPTVAPTAPAANPTAAVVALPNTGQGSSTDNTSSIILLLGAMSLVAGAAAYTWYQRRTN